MRTVKQALGYVCLVAATVLVACSHDNPYFCEGAPHNNCLDIDAAGDGPKACSGDQDCSGALAVCDVDGSKTCVQCTSGEHQACVDVTPVCGMDDACHACTAHDQCDSKACLPDGSCGSDTNVAYIDPAGTDNAMCTLAIPCTKVVKALATARPFVKFHGSTSESVSINNQDVTLLADPGAALTQTSVGVVLEVKGTSHVPIYDLTVTGGLGPTGIGVSVPAGSGATVDLERATVSNNTGGGVIVASGSVIVSRSRITDNAGGGLSITGVGTTFDVRNTFITYNGVPTGANASQIGGASILSNTADAKFEFNTVAYNKDDGSIFRGGVSCTGALVSAIGNIVYQNTENTTTSDATQSGGACQFGNTLSLGTTAGDLGFASPTMTPFDFHLTVNSPPSVVDAGGACTGIDIDGDTRPIGPACDLGADELKK